MSNYAFHKMQALGNDFILIDARQQSFDLSPEQIALWSDRHTGIGCDQWLIIEPARHSNCLASYRIFNADGSTAEQCLNGLRCIVWYLARQEQQAEMVLDSPTDIVQAKVTTALSQRQQKSMVELELAPPGLGADAVAWRGQQGTESKSAEPFPIRLDSACLEAIGVNMGNPHAVIFVTDARQSRARFGVKVSTHEQFSNGANAGFAERLNPSTDPASKPVKNSLFLCVFERGAGPTHACGSGACAAAVAAIQGGHLKSPVMVHQPGGQLVVDWQGEGYPVHLRGSAEYVFSGEFIDESNG